MSKELSLSFVAGEIIRPGTDLELRTTRPFDPDIARAAIVFQQDGLNIATPFTIDEKSGTIKVSTKGLGPGKYQLRIHELLDTENKQIVNHMVIPLGIDDLVGEVPPELRIEHATHLAIGKTDIVRLDPGDQEPSDFDYVEFVKAIHREKGDPVDLAFDKKGDRVDGQKLLKDLQHRRYNKFGSLHETLFNHLERGKDSDRVDVVVWPRVQGDLTGYEKPNHGEIKEPPPEARDRMKEALRSRSDVVDILKKLGGTVKDTPEEALAIYASLTVSQARKLAKSDGIGKAFLDDRTGVLDLVDSLAVAHATEAQALGYTGVGVHAAVFEAGPSDLADLQFAGRFQPNPPASAHARLTSAIVKNVEPGKPHGYAPNCLLYSANSYDNAALQWAVRPPQSCTVISQSFHRLSSEGQDEQGSPSMSADDVLKDHLATMAPFPTIVHAAGNLGITPLIEYVNHKGFNTLSVGSHDDHATAMAGSSVFKNPASPHGDRELPELAANGTGVSAVHESMSGTSFAAPAVAGTAALIQSTDATLKSWPEGCRAILLAGADRNISGGTWVEDLGKKVDQSDGSGALNARMAVLIAQQRRQRNAPATPRGWDVGSLTTADFGTDRLAKFRYHVQVPPSATGSILYVYTVKAALAWDSKVTLNTAGVATSSVLTVDLDLIVRDSSTGLQVAASASYDNSYEIVEFTAIAGRAYDIIIRRWSGTDLVWYGVAWNVTARLFNVAPMVAGAE
ncbi:peptidase S8/S53 domain-containing protein [Tricladium varicosporioides]|nr:peptidase S8/S53 domain-containing protein [Hymenoscyphus varicosporioides]